jgi:hypothetical protein
MDQSFFPQIRSLLDRKEKQNDVIRGLGREMEHLLAGLRQAVDDEVMQPLGA